MAQSTTFTVALDDAAVPQNATDTLANIISILEIPAPTSQPLEVKAVDLTFTGGASGNKEVLCQLALATATGTFPNSSLTPQCTNADGSSVSTLVNTTNIKFGTATAEGTIATGKGYRLYRISPLSGVIYQIPLGEEFWIPKSDFLRVRMVATTSGLKVCINVAWGE